MVFTSRSECKGVQSSLYLALYNSGLALASFTFMAIKIHAYPASHQVTSLERSRWMGKSLRHYGHHSMISLGASVGCPWFIGKRYWMPTWTILIGRRWFTLVCAIYISNMRYPNISVTVPSLLKRWKRLETGLDLSAETFSALSKRFKEKVKPWLKAEKHAQLNRHQDSTLMDIYYTITTKGMDTECIWSSQY